MQTQSANANAAARCGGIGRIFKINYRCLKTSDLCAALGIDT